MSPDNKITSKGLVGSSHHYFVHQIRLGLSSKVRLPRLISRAILLCLSLFCSGSALAWGFGEVRVLSALGEPFRAQISLLGSDVANVEKSCFKGRLQTFDGAFLGAITVSVRENNLSLHVTTHGAVNEPAALLTVGYACSPQMQREYAILLDLPAMQPVAPVVAARRADARDASSVSISSGDAPSTKKQFAETAAPKEASRSSSRRVVSETKSGESGKQQPKEPAKETDQNVVAARSKSVLKLGGETSLDPVRVFRPGLALSYSLATPPAESEQMAALPVADTDGSNAATIDSDPSLQKLLDKIDALERKTVALQKHNAEQLSALDQARKVQTSAGPMTILYGLLLACAVAIGWLIWRMQQLRSSGAISWQQIIPQVGTRRTDAEAVPVKAHVEERQAEHRSSPVATIVMPDPSVSASGDVYPVDRRSVANAEEILDEILEAEFWVHMNQPQRAIAILETEVQPASPLKWLHLVDLYRMVDDREKYEALAIRFKQLFNGRIAPWESEDDTGGVRDIEDFPQLMERVMAVWQTDQAIDFLEGLLVDDREGSRAGFDLPAYRDLLFLTNLAYQVQVLRDADSKDLEPLAWPFPGT